MGICCSINVAIGSIFELFLRPYDRTKSWTLEMEAVMRNAFAAIVIAPSCVLMPAMAHGEPSKAVAPPFRECTGTVLSIEADQNPVPAATMWLGNLGCTTPPLNIPIKGFSLVESASGHTWMAGLTVAAAAYKRVNVAERIVTVVFDASSGDLPIVIRINAPCMAVGSHCAGKGAAQKSE